jgi:integrase
MPTASRAKPPKTPPNISARWSDRENRWRYTWRAPRDANRHRERSPSCATIRECEEWRDSYLAQKSVGKVRPSRAGALSVDAMFERYVAEHAQRHLSEGAWRGYQYTYKKWISPWLGGDPLRDLSVRRLVQHHNLLLDETDATPNGRRRALIALQSMYAYAIDIGEAFEPNPVKSIKKPSTKRQRAVNVVLPETVEQIRSALLEVGDLGSATMVSVLAYSGVRPGEQLGLRWSSWNPGAMLTVDSRVVEGELIPGHKNDGPPRQLAPLAALHDDLAAWRAAQPSPPFPAALIFPHDLRRHLGVGNRGRLGAGANEPWSKYQWGSWRRYVWAPALERIGVPYFRPYDLRHSYVSLRLREGKVNRYVLAAENGHSVTVMEETYAHVIRELDAFGPIDPDAMIQEARAKAHARRAA